jgi:predicted site-specific integrase-resolvase
MDWIPATAAARRLGVTSRTLRRYAGEGKLPDVRGAGNRRIFLVSDIDALTSKRGAGKATGYALVSSRRQQAEGDPGRRAARLRAAVAAEARSGDAA